MTNDRDDRPEGSASDGERPKIKVVDRRMFDTEGNPRQPEFDDSQTRSDDAAPAAAVEDASPPPEPETSSMEQPAESESPPQSTSTEEKQEEATFADLPRDFSAFVESQYLEALIFLGAMPHPQTGETIEDPAFASYKIDLLAMLQEKTEGNLTTEEARLIEDVLYQLRMLYVQKSKGTPS
jgi:hypothetical protein